MRVQKLALIFFLSVFAALLYFLFHGAPPHYLLLRRLKQLEAQNERLHSNLQELLTATGNSSTNGQVGLLQGGEREDISGRQSSESCETVHVVMVVSGSLAVRQTMVVVKSILFHRHNPLHFHFLTDNRGKEVLSVVFETWRLPQVAVSLYPIAATIRMVEWIPNTHYSGLYGLTKLTFASILPPWLKGAIALDTDLLFSADIALLWRYLKTLRENQKQLGLVENQSDWYLGNIWKDHRPWPALGRGFNTGVILLNLELMRSKNWNETWHSTARENLALHKKVALADQDIINAAIKRNKGLVFILPCDWNIQLSENTLSEYCFKRARNFKVIHWNSARKLGVQNVHAAHFRNLFVMFDEYDSTLSRTLLSDCPTVDSTANDIADDDDDDDSDPCLDFRRESKHVHRVHPFYLDYSYQSSLRNDVTLVAQMSMDRLHMLEPLCRHWEGPLSIAVHASDSDARQLVAHVAASPLLRETKRLALHIVSKGSRFYPVNHLRNVALGHVRTPYVFLSDADFLPMHGLYHYLKEAINVLMGAEEMGKERKKRALVVPAFESLLYRINFPRNKTELLTMLQTGELFTFRQHVWQQAHSQTNFDHWKEADHPYRVSWAENFEPYLVVSRNVSRYDERFVGFGWNKVSHVMELHAQGYEFVVLPGAFMVHLPHAPSAEITSFRQNKHYRDCMQVLKREFKKELLHKYHNMQA